MSDESKFDWDDDSSNNTFDIEQEDTNAEDLESIEKPFDADKIRVDAKPFSVRQMQDMIKDGLLNLNPGFQRRKVWKERKRKSLLIESLMLRIPLPVFYVYEDDDAVWHVVDGLQRMSTISEFLNGEFRLTGLQYLKHSNDKTFIELDQKYKTRITTTTLTANVIDSRTPPQVKYDIFRRINTGGVPLNAQEIRHSTARERVRQFLTELVESTEFKLATNESVNDMRMEAQELILRFIAFYDSYDSKTGKVFYKKSMENFLDEAFERLNMASTETLRNYQYVFLSAMKSAHSMFGKYAFRRIDTDEIINSQARLRPLNKSLFTCLSVVLAQYEHTTIKRKKLGDKPIMVLCDKLKDSNNNEFNEALTKGTGDPSRIYIQFKTMTDMMRGLIND